MESRKDVHLASHTGFCALESAAIIRFGRRAYDTSCCSYLCYVISADSTEFRGIRDSMRDTIDDQLSLRPLDRLLILLSLFGQRQKLFPSLLEFTRKLDVHSKRFPQVSSVVHDSVDAFMFKNSDYGSRKIDEGFANSMCPA